MSIHRLTANSLPLIDKHTTAARASSSCSSSSRNLRIRRCRLGRERRWLREDKGRDRNTRAYRVVLARDARAKPARGNEGAVERVQGTSVGSIAATSDQQSARAHGAREGADGGNTRDGGDRRRRSGLCNCAVASLQVARESARRQDGRGRVDGGVERALHETAAVRVVPGDRSGVGNE